MCKMVIELKPNTTKFSHGDIVLTSKGGIAVVSIKSTLYPINESSLSLIFIYNPGHEMTAWWNTYINQEADENIHQLKIVNNINKVLAERW